MTDEDFMALALAQARQAAALGEVPVGAIVVHQGKVIASGHNRPISAHDPTAHAEMVALRAAAQALGNYRLDGCEMFVTLEPCAMCSGAMLNARFKRVVFGAAEPKTGAAGSVINLFAQRQLNHQTEWQGGVLAQASRSLLQEFFRFRRADQRVAARQRHPLRDDALRTPDSAFEALAGYPWQARYVSNLPALGGLRMHYLDEQMSGATNAVNARRTYLCLHDGTTWSYAFRHLMPFLLQSGHRVVAPDLIGFGKSDKPKKQGFHTFDSHRNIVLELVENLDLHNIVLVLFEPSALLGLTLPVEAPQRYLGIQQMSLDGGQAQSCDYLPLVQGFRLWQQTTGALPLPSQACKLAGRIDNPPECVALESASDSPFPGESFRVAVHAFPVMLARAALDKGAATLSKSEAFWLHCLGA